MPIVVGTILHHRNPKGLGHVIESVGRQTHPVDRLIVLDNGGAEELDPADLFRSLAERSIPFELRTTSTNLGVGGGHNVLIDQALAADADWLWMLEHDTIPDPRCLEKLLAVAEGSRSLKLGAVVPNFARDESERELAESFAREAAERDDLERLTFNAVLVSSAAARAVGRLREDFFVGGEDWDFSERLHAAGWEIVAQVEVSGTHRTRGGRRHGEWPSPSRQYYSVRHALLREPANSRARARAGLRAVAGLARDVTRPSPWRRMLARLAGVSDGLRSRGGPASYRFMADV